MSVLGRQVDQRDYEVIGFLQHGTQTYLELKLECESGGEDGRRDGDAAPAMRRRRRCRRRRWPTQRGRRIAYLVSETPVHEFVLKDVRPTAITFAPSFEQRPLLVELIGDMVAGVLVHMHSAKFDDGPLEDTNGDGLGGVVLPLPGHRFSGGVIDVLEQVLRQLQQFLYTVNTHLAAQ